MGERHTTTPPAPTASCTGVVQPIADGDTIATAAISAANMKARAPLRTAPGTANTPGGVDMAKSTASRPPRTSTGPLATWAYRRRVRAWNRLARLAESKTRKAYDRLVELEHS